MLEIEKVSKNFRSGMMTSLRAVEFRSPLYFLETNLTKSNVKFFTTKHQIGQKNTGCFIWKFLQRLAKMYKTHLQMLSIKFTRNSYKTNLCCHFMKLRAAVEIKLKHWSVSVVKLLKISLNKSTHNQSRKLCSWLLIDRASIHQIGSRSRRCVIQQ